MPTTLARACTWLLAAGFVLGPAAPVQAEETLAADVHETVFKLPVTVQTMAGATVSRDVTVTQYRPDGDGPFPIAVLLHGRSHLDRAQPARQRYVQAARYFVRRGFAVWVPTRIGYGESGTSPDPEDSGACQRKHYGPGFEAAATTALTVIEHAKKQAFADPARVVVLGQSYGGASAIALAAKNPPGLLAVINFAGGSGGNPDTRPGDPCSPQLLEQAFARYGQSARVPSLWVYTGNDQYMGSEQPRKWHAAFVRQGAAAEFRALPEFGEDGHALFGKGFAIWRPIVDDFLSRHGVLIPKSAGAPMPTAYAALDALARVPLVNRSGREKYERFLHLDIPRAYAIGPRGEFGYSSSLDAMTRALDACKKFAKTDCKLYAVDDHIVWKE